MNIKKSKKQIGIGGLILDNYQKKLVNEVLDSNQLSYGSKTRRFEKMFSKIHQVKHSIFMNSGTSALHLALTTLKYKYNWQEQDEVLVPAVTFVATSNIVLHNNLIPIFVEVESHTYNIDPDKIEERITKKTKAIIVVHLLGLPASMSKILMIAKKYNLRIIEDSAECMFAKYKNKSVGSFGDIGCFSTYIAHYLVTGIGGFAITNNINLATNLRSLMNHGRDVIYTSSTDDSNLNKKQLEKVVKKRFNFVKIGHSMRCTEMESALGIGQLQRYKETIKRRKQIANIYLSEFSKYQDRMQLPTTPDDRDHTYMLFGLVLRKENKRKIVNYLENYNVETRDLLPLINQPIYKKLYGNLEKFYPVAKWINKSGFYIGCHPFLSDKDLDYIINIFKKFFKEN